ncbi:MAG: hypothetical protein ACTSYX_00660 [Candidatus Thorarchaeota archaeon]
MVLIILPIAFVVTGCLILIVTFLRLRRLRRYGAIVEDLESRFDVADLDLSGETQYTDCFSHEWVINNISRRRYGRVSRGIQNFMSENTLIGSLLMGLIVGAAAVIIGLLFVESVSALGAAVGVFFVGALVAMGPSDPRISEQLLVAISKAPPDSIRKEDYVYVRLAIDSITGWERTALLLGIAFIVISPWADFVPSAVAFGIATMASWLILEPAQTIAAVNFPLAFLYMIGMVVILFYYVPRTLLRLVRRREPEEEREESMARW